MRNFIFCILFSALFIGCQTTSKTGGKHSDRGIWSGKVQMINKTTNHKKWANVTWASDSSKDLMRVNVSAVFDVPIATYLKNKEGAHLWLFNERHYYQSNDAQKLFLHLTKLSVDPNIFYNLLGPVEKPGKGWSCKRSSVAMDCYSSSKKVGLLAHFKSSDERVIRITKGEKALVLKLFRSKVEVSETVFSPLSTSQFKTIQL